MAYRVVDDYYRQDHFDLFRGYACPFYALTFELDVSAVRAMARARGWSVYLNLCYVFTRAIQDLEDFRYRIRDGRIVLYDRLDIAATLPAPGRRFSFGFFDFDPDMERFNRRAAEIAAAASKQVTLAEPGDTNHLLFTALPRVPFTGLTHALPPDPLDTRPRVAFGRFDRAGERVVVPVGLEVNHVFIDGEALGDLVERVEAAMAQPLGSGLEV